MSFTIEKIILWSKDLSPKKRIIPFDSSKINVISGDSGKGKSALIYIVDYCLGSKKCGIPTGLIRNSVAWFGILLQFNDRQVIVARKEPSLGEGNTYMDESEKIEIPNSLEANCNVSDVKKMFNNYLELSNIDFREDEGAVGFQSPPSSRDLVSVVFQPQHIIANAYALFFKADTYEHREKLKTIFPYILGIIDDEILELKEELKLLNRKKLKIENEIRRKEESVSGLLNDISNYYFLAKSYGLLPNSPEKTDGFSQREFLVYLKEAVTYLDDNEIPQIQIGITAKVSNRIAILTDRENLLASQVHQIEEKLVSIRTLSKTNIEYGRGLLVQQDRTKTASWFNKVLTETEVCQFCGSESTSTKDYVRQMEVINKELKELSYRAGDFHKVFAREIKVLEKQLGVLETELNSVRSELKNLYDKDSEFKKHRLTLNRIYKFVGTLEEALKNYDAISPDGELRKSLIPIDKRISKITAIFNKKKLAEKEKAAINKIGNTIKVYADIFNAEHKDSDIQLDLQNLTLKFVKKNGQSDFLWEIGSGHNYMAYHLSIMLALHEYFLSLKSNNKVPSFLFFDQPSQVYFPELKDENQLQDDDLQRVRKIFEAFSTFNQRTKSKTQIIVLEHAGENAWENETNVVLVKRWRQDEDDNALIPKDWF